MSSEQSGYHITKIRKGVYGQLSKIQEELDEAIDAFNQGNRIMVLHELSDIIGSIKGFIDIYFPDFGLVDLIKMAEATDNAFKTGHRK